jgi:DNA modification methylase
LIKPYYHDEQYGITIYHADCRGILPHLDPVDLVLTSPPFLDDDVPIEYYEWLLGILSIPYKSFVMFNSSRRLIEICRRFNPVKVLIWDKVRTESAFRYEPIFVFGEMSNGLIFNDCIRHLPVIGKKQLVPYENPTALYQQLLRYFPSDTTVDPFMGSGTTLVAAKQLGRKAIGIEIEEKYCEIAVQRLQQGVLQYK